MVDPAPIDPVVLDRSVVGVRLTPGTLREQLAPGEPTLLVFLRHFGCLFCRETVADLRAVAEKRPEFPKVLFFTQGSTTETRVFLSRYWPEARAVSDPRRELYDAFGLERTGFTQMLRPDLWRANRRARAKGIESGPRVGDIWMMPGLFLVQEGAVLWSHRFAHAGDHPEFDRIPAIARAAAAGAVGR